MITRELDGSDSPQGPSRASDATMPIPERVVFPAITDEPHAASRLVCFAHGKESGPWGTKITHLARVARNQGFEVLSPDYSHTHDPRVRIEQLLTLAPRAECLVLVGSSMGGYVSAFACEQLKPEALMLLAPAFYFPGYDEEPAAIPELCSVIHGWHDDIVPVDRSIRFARNRSAELHLLNSDHSLNDQLPALSRLLEDLLSRAALRSAHKHRAHLEQAYSRARYTVGLASGEISLFIGQLNLAVEDRLRDAGVSRQWHIVTPFNPRSQREDGERNRANLERLRNDLHLYGVRFLPSISRDPMHFWPEEEGFLLIDAPEGLAERLGRQYEQNAIVQGGPGRAPQLVWL